MDQITAILVLAGIALVVLMLPVIGTLFLAAAAAAIFVWRKIFPLGWGIAEWVTNRRNLIPFVLFVLIVIAGSIILLILSYVFATQVHWIGYLFILLFLFILLIAETIFWGGLGLAIILWIVRLSHWAYALFRRGFWRTFRPGGPPDFQPVPVPLTNPVLVAPPRSKSNSNRRRQPLAKRRIRKPIPVVASSKGKDKARAKGTGQSMEEKLSPKANAKKSSIRTKEEKKVQAHAGAQEKAKAKEEAKQAKEQAREAKRTQAIAKAEEKARAKEEAKRAKEQAREEKRAQAIAGAEEKAQANEEVKQAKPQAKEDDEQAKAQAKEESKQAMAEESFGENATPRRRRRLKRNK